MNKEDPKETGDMFARTIQREQVGKQYQPSKTDVALAMSDYYPSVRRTMDAPNTDLQEFVGLLKTIKEGWTRTNGIPPSRPLLTVLPITERVEWLNNIADTAIKQNDRLLYVFCYDVSLGISHTVDMIGHAENAISQGVNEMTLKGESEIDEFLDSKVIGVEVPIDKQVDSHLGIISDLTDAVALLKEDPTGYLLVEQAAKRVRGEKNRFKKPAVAPSGYIPKFIAVGADLAENAYKAIYKLTDGI